MEEELAYVSSSPMLATQKPPVKVQDEKDLSTLVKVQKMLVERIAAYNTIAYLTVDEKDFTVKEQLAISQAIIVNLQEIKLTVDSAINNVKEKYGGQ